VSAGQCDSTRAQSALAGLCETYWHPLYVYVRRRGYMKRIVCMLTPLALALLAGPGSPFKKNTELWDPACERAEKAGILVLDCTHYHGSIGPCYYDAADPENVSKCKPGFPSQPDRGALGGDQSIWLLVPCSPKTTAEEYVKGDCGYQYDGQGGLSWSIPYSAGVLALGWQAQPNLTAQEMRALLFKSAYKTPDGSQIINPPEFIRLVKAYRS
jgi:hypothetical protein